MFSIMTIQNASFLCNKVLFEPFFHAANPSHVHCNKYIISLDVQQIGSNKICFMSRFRTAESLFHVHLNDCRQSVRTGRKNALRSI